MSVLSVNIVRLSSQLKQRGNRCISQFYPFLMGNTDDALATDDTLNITDTANQVNWVVHRDAVDNSKYQVSAYKLDGTVTYNPSMDTFSENDDQTAEVILTPKFVSNNFSENDQLDDLLDATCETESGSLSIQDSIQKQIQYGNLELCMASVLDQFRSVDEVSAVKLAAICDQYHQYADDDVAKFKSDILTSSSGNDISAFSIINIIRSSLETIKDALASNDLELPEGAVYKYDSILDMFTIGNIISGLGAVMVAVGGIVVKIIGALISIAGWLIGKISEIRKITQATYDEKVHSGYWNFFLYKGSIPSTQTEPLSFATYRDENNLSHNVLNTLYDRYGNTAVFAIDFGGVTVYQWKDSDGCTNVTGYAYNKFNPELFADAILSNSGSVLTRTKSYEFHDPFINPQSSYGNDLCRYVQYQKRIYTPWLTEAIKNSTYDNASSIVTAGSNYLASLALSIGYYALMSVINLRADNYESIMWPGGGIDLEYWDSINEKWRYHSTQKDTDTGLQGMTPFIKVLYQICNIYTDYRDSTKQGILDKLNDIGSQFIQDLSDFRNEDVTDATINATSWLLDTTDFDSDGMPIYGNNYAVSFFPTAFNGDVHVGAHPANIDNVFDNTGEDFFSDEAQDVNVYVTDCYPTKFTYSAPLVSKEALINFLKTIAVVITVVSVVAITSKIVKFKLRRSLEYRGGRNLAKAKDEWLAGNITDKQFRKAVKKYNRRARLLGIRTYDPINGWFDYPSSSSAAESVSSITTSWGFGEGTDMSKSFDGTMDSPSAATTLNSFVESNDEAISLLNRLISLIKPSE